MVQHRQEYAELEFELGQYLERRRAATDDEILNAIDEEIWEKYGEYWSILYTDLSGFSREVIHHGIIFTLGIIHIFREIALPIIALHGGILMKTEGDSLIILFREVEDSLKAALEMSAALERYNGEHEEHQIFNASGIGYGRILKLGDYDMYGLEVNLASKLGEDIGKGSDILLTEAARLQLDKTRPGEYEEIVLGELEGLKAFRLVGR